MRGKRESTSPLRKLRVAVSAMYATAVDDGLVRSNPIAGVRIPAVAREPRRGRPKAKALTRADLAVLLAAIPADRRLFFEFLAHTGLRISETIGLRWQHIELGECPRVEVREQVYNGQRRR